MENKIKYQNATQRLVSRMKTPFQYVQPAGDPEKQEYEPVYDKKGCWHLEKTKKSNLYAEIQSHYASTDLNLIMQRYRNGETDVLQQVQGFYGDVSNVPTNYADLLNEKLKAEALFSSLDADTRSKFDNSPEQFIIQLGNGDAWTKLGLNPDGTPIAPSDPEKKDGENNG